MAGESGCVRGVVPESGPRRKCNEPAAAQEGWMMRLKIIVLALALAMPLAGCVVYPTPPPRAGAVWVPGYYGPYGHWHQGHWS